MMHRADWQGRRASSGMAFAWFDWDCNHHRPLARHLGGGHSATTTAVSEAVTTASVSAIELLKAAS
jgi:hypothetical protein